MLSEQLHEAMKVPVLNQGIQHPAGPCAPALPLGLRHPDHVSRHQRARLQSWCCSGVAHVLLYIRATSRSAMLHEQSTGLQLISSLEGPASKALAHCLPQPMRRLLMDSS